MHFLLIFLSFVALQWTGEGAYHVLPRAYATGKHARELYEPILPKTPYPPETKINNSIISTPINQHD